MNPETSTELYSKLAQPRLESLQEEYMRRNLVAGVLKDVSDLFNSRETTRNPITEPALFARFYALSQVQRTHLGVTGFNPLTVVRFEEGVVSLEAKIAPPHDEVTLDDGTTLRSRLINITLPEPNGVDDNPGLSWGQPHQIKQPESDIEIFGINIFLPDVDIEAALTESENVPKKGLALVSRGGEVRKKPQPVTGETVLFGVRNRRTNDAKLYAIIREPQEDTEDLKFVNSIAHKKDGSCVVLLPDGIFMSIKSLAGAELNQAVEEIVKGSDTLKGNNSTDSTLSPEEQVAVGQILEQPLHSER